MFHWYGLIVGIATVVWWILAERIEPKVKTIIPWLLLAALLGARLYHVADYWEYYQQNLWQIVEVWRGGLSIWGAIIAGGLVAIASGKDRLVAVITPLPLAQAIGRVANGVNGEFSNPVRGIPWWATEAILDLLLFGLVWWLPGRHRVAAYLVGYGLIRLALVPFRL